MQCISCAAPLVEHQKFCEECGTRVHPAEAESPPASAAPPASPTAAPARTTCRCAPGQALRGADGYCESCGMRLRPEPVCIALDNNLALVSDIGRQYPVNQDAGHVGPGLAGQWVMIVADGVSSADRAEIASSTAVAAAYQTLASGTPSIPSVPESLHIPVASGNGVVPNEQLHLPRAILAVQAVTDAHAAVLALPWENQAREEPETTICCALIEGQRATIAWVGDSRAYLIRPARPEQSRQITRDDSWLADALDDGQMTPEAAMADKRAHAITQCLGMRDDTPQIHVCEIELREGEQLLLCTDGLWNYVEDAPGLTRAILQAGQHASAIEVCQHLVNLANMAGGRDNITVGWYQPGVANA